MSDVKKRKIEQNKKRRNSLSSVIGHLTSVLCEAGIDNAALDARLLIAHALGLDRAQLLTQADRVLTGDETQRIETLVARRVQREPVSRILGLREFWGLPFGLNEATLDPRPDSETVVESVIRNQMSDVKRRIDFDIRHRASDIRILDLGTGTGCLLLALLHELPNATGLGIDCAPRAVAQAKENAKRLGLAARAEFRVNNWADGIEECFDIIVSNPPYIARAEIVTLMPEVRDYDPALALDGGEDGLAVYRLLVPQLGRLLKPVGIAVFEIGKGQAESVRELFQNAGFKNVETHRDLAGIERCIMTGSPLSRG